MTPHDQTNNPTPHYITRLASMQALRFRSRGFAVFRVAEIKRRATGPFCLVNLTAAVSAGDALDQLGIIGTLKLLPSRGAATEIRQSTITPLKKLPLHLSLGAGDRQKNGDGTFRDSSKQAGTDREGWSTGGPCAACESGGNLDVSVEELKRQNVPLGWPRTWPRSGGAG
jgi:hypothetical protein